MQIGWSTKNSKFFNHVDNFFFMYFIEFIKLNQILGRLWHR